MKNQKKESKADTSGEQLDLIDVSPKNAKPIVKAARIYIKYRDERMALGAKEVEHKQKVIKLVEAAELQPLEGGKIKFEYDGIVISLAPQDVKLTVKDNVDVE